MVDRFGSFTFFVRQFLVGNRESRCAMVFSRAAFLLSERTMCHGATLVSVFFSIRSRAREYSYQRFRDGRSIGLSFHCRTGSLMRASNRRFCSSLLTSSQSLIRIVPPSTRISLDLRTQLQESLVLFLRAEAHHVLDAGAVVPAAIEDDDFAGRGEVLQVALHVDLGLLAVRGRRQGDDPEDARAETLGDRANRAPLAGAVTAFEHDDDAQALFLDPALQMAQPTCSFRSSFSYSGSFHYRPSSVSEVRVASPSAARTSLPIVLAHFGHVVEAARLS